MRDLYSIESSIVTKYQESKNKVWQGQRVIFTQSLTDKYGNEVLEYVEKMIKFDNQTKIKLIIPSINKTVDFKLYQYIWLAQITDKSFWHKWQRLLPSDSQSHVFKTEIHLRNGSLRNLELTVAIRSMNPQMNFMFQWIYLRNQYVNKYLDVF